MLIILLLLKKVQEIFITDSVLKTNFWTYELKDLNGETVIEIFMK